MLSIGKLVGGNEHYYLHTVASGVEDYYIGRGEAPGFDLTFRAPKSVSVLLAELLD